MKKVNKYIGIVCSAVILGSCAIPDLVQKSTNKSVPESYSSFQDTTNSAEIKWKEFFNDPYLASLIDTALSNNQELNMMLQEINITENEVLARKGEYLPFLRLLTGGGTDKVGRYTRNGAVEHNLEIDHDTEFPEPLNDFFVSANVSWEIDIWKKLRNAKKAAALRYLSTVEGKNFLVTNLVAEIASSYYELKALDNQLEILKSNIEIQQNALRIVKLQKQSAKDTELAVKKFEAEVLKNKSDLFYIRQEIREVENRINFLVGRYPQPISRNSFDFVNKIPNQVFVGLPSQLLERRPDVREAELLLEASKLDVKVAKANFYPSLDITAGLGYQAFNPKFLLRSPESMLYNVAGDLVAPVLNRAAIKAEYKNANAEQISAVYNYEMRVLEAYIEVLNEVSRIDNLKSSYEFRSQQVDALTQSISISSNLFRSARADYMEVLMTQRDALEAKLELIETRKDQQLAVVNLYQALGGGWE